MKTIYNFKKQSLLFLLLLMSGFSWGQIVYTGFPTTVAGASNTTGTLTLSGCTTYTGAYLKAYISLINGNQISITTFKQDGNNFGTGNLKIIDANNCTVSLASTTTSTLAGAAPKKMMENSKT